jgi:SAM-dependent methyltransferase
MENLILQDEETLKAIVREKYAQIARQSKAENEGSCCGSSCGCDTVDYSVMADDASQLAGYNPDADLALGCGLPTEYAQIKAGDTVVDLGSGAGNDAFIARALVGESGKVIGIDMTEAMLDKARQNAEKLGFNNVEFRLGEIEKMPLSSNVADVVVSNCVMNLVPNKTKAFAETFRILKQKGHFSISDIVLEGKLPEGMQNDAEMYAGCVSGAIQKADYLAIIKQAGFQNIEVQKSKKISLPEELLAKYLNNKDLERYNRNEFGIYSITVFAEKPCCEPGSGCC